MQENGRITQLALFATGVRRQDTTFLLSADTPIPFGRIYPPMNWKRTSSVQEWWTEIVGTRGVSRKGLKSLVILVCWEIWNKCNACIFNSTEALSFTVAEKIKGEASAWIMAGAKHLACLIS